MRPAERETPSDETSSDGSPGAGYKSLWESIGSRGQRPDCSVGAPGGEVSNSSLAIWRMNGGRNWTLLGFAAVIMKWALSPFFTAGGWEGGAELGRTRTGAWAPRVVKRYMETAYVR